METKVRPSLASTSIPSPPRRHSDSHAPSEEDDDEEDDDEDRDGAAADPPRPSDSAMCAWRKGNELPIDRSEESRCFKPRKESRNKKQSEERRRKSSLSRD